MSRPPPSRVLLCIDDRPHLLQLRATLLGKHGYVVVTANSVVEVVLVVIVIYFAVRFL